ncbi:MAG: Flp pilus assembly protein CpaB [Solirubrobacteraceae bacterium]
MQTLKPPKLKPPKLSKDGAGPLSTKNGAIGAAIVAAAIAGLIIVFFLQQYRNNVDEGGVPTPVLVAQKLIEQGASGDTIGAQGLFKTSDVPRDQLKKGAVTDPTVLKGKVAVDEILPGQQLTAKDFKAAGSGIVTKLAADQRAISVTVDNAHGLTGNVRTGDHVDVLSGFNTVDGARNTNAVLWILEQDVLVLAAPDKASSAGVGGGANKTSEVTLRVKTTTAPKIAFTADNGKLWLALRPQNGAAVDHRTLVTLTSLLAGEKALKVAPRRSPGR